MAVAGSDADPKPAKRSPVRIGPWPRAVSGVLGLGGLAAGGTATFTRNVEAGPVALIAVGTLFMLVALAGYLPSRLRIGDNEAEWMETVSEALAEVTELVPNTSKVEAAAALEEVARVQPSLARPALDAVAYERAIFSTIAEVIRMDSLKERPALFTLETYGQDGRLEFDGVLKGRNGRRLAIEIKALSRPLSAATVWQVVGKLREWQSADQQTLLVSRSQPTDEARRALEQLRPYVHFVVVDDPRKHEDLATLIEDIFRQGEGN